MKNKIPLQPGEFLNLAHNTVNQRGTDNGYDAGQERSAAKVAKVFNALTDHNLSESDVWTLLIVLKQVRNQRKFKMDNIVDMIGYASLLGECLDSNDETITDYHESPRHLTGNVTVSEKHFPLIKVDAGAHPQCEHSAWESLHGNRYCADCGVKLPPCQHPEGKVKNGCCLDCGTTFTCEPK